MAYTRRTAKRKPARRSYGGYAKRKSVRRAAPRRKTAAKSKIYVQQLTPTARFVISQLDPFEPKCLGAKIPDSNTMPSIANCDTDQVSLLGSTAATHLAVAFRPNYQTAVQEATAGVGGVSWASPTTTTRRNANNVTNSIEAIRPVAHAIRLSCPLAPTTTTGFVHVGLSVESRNVISGNTWEYPTTVNAMTGLAHYKRFTLASLTQTPITCINKWIDELAFRYEDPRAIDSVVTGTPNSSTLQYFGSWATIVIMVEGGPSTTGTVLSFEHILHTEALPKKDAFIMGNPAAPNSPATMSVVSQMQSDQDFAHTEAQQESYIQRGVESMTRGAQNAGAYFAETVVLPVMENLGGRVVNTAANMAMNAVFGRGGLPGVNNNAGRLALQ
jgi:hypothetical protein